MKCKVNQERKRGLNLTNTMYDNWEMYVRCEINRMMKCICLSNRTIAKYDNIHTFQINLSELDEQITLRVNFDEFRQPNEIITYIIKEVKNHINTKIMA